jgi:hypothetical protein
VNDRAPAHPAGPLGGELPLDPAAAPEGRRDQPLGVLQRIVQAPRRRPGERCELCGDTIGEDHRHVVNLVSRSLLCSCRPCFLLFDHPGVTHGRYKAVPDRYRSFPGFQLSRAQWDELQIPVGLAFLFANSQLERTVAFYPSPAGATESVLPLEAWDELVTANPELAALEPDVEALLVRVRDHADTVCYLVPIDRCYELVGHLRMLWKGFDGGQEARARIEEFFDDVAARSRA